MKTKRISNSFSEDEVEWMHELLNVVNDQNSVWDKLLRLQRKPELASVYSKVLNMKKKLEVM